MELRKYQKEAVSRLKEGVNRLLTSAEREICIFQAPTGSGKTFIMSELLRALAKDRKDEKKLSFIWISVRMLHEQSKEKLENYYENERLIQCSYYEDLEDKQISENEILFINWHSINKKDINIYVRENEQDNNLNSIIERTKEEGRDIILIIDESHHTASSEKSRELIEVIGPKVTIEVSATPHLKESMDDFVKVNLADVKAEEMIKSEISVNPEFLEVKVGRRSSDELVIGEALTKREVIARHYKEEGSDVNPLVLVQLPDQKGDLVNKKDYVLKLLKDKFKITEENAKLAVWLSEEKTESLLNIEKNDNSVEVLVFKQAPALGWDCPRACILVLFRESTSFRFTIQTIGRIMRMPEWKYYNEAELNRGFVFTNHPNIEITEDYARDYVSIYEAKRDDELYREIGIPSIYLRRQRERTRLSGKFSEIFMQIAEARDLKKKLIFYPSRIVRPLIADGRITNIDKKGEIEHKGTLDVDLNPVELQQAFDTFISQNCTPFAPADSSDRMKSAIYNFSSKKLKLKKYDPHVQRIVLGKENVQSFVDVINLAKERFKEEVIEKLAEKRELQETPKWEVPSLISYNSRYSKVERDKSIMKPFYTRQASDPEMQFQEFLQESKKVKWWFKNGENEEKYFAVLYKDEGGYERAFYVDFLIQFVDGSLGLFDTKSGITAKEAKEKAEGLQEYIATQNKKGSRLWGGIVINVKGSWRYNDAKSYAYDEKTLKDWKVLEI